MSTEERKSSKWIADANHAGEFYYDNRESSILIRTTGNEKLQTFQNATLAERMHLCQDILSRANFDNEALCLPVKVTRSHLQKNLLTFFFLQMQSWTFWTSVLIVNCDISALSLADFELKTAFLQQKHLRLRRTNLPDWIAKLLFIKDRFVDNISTTQEGFFSISRSLNRRKSFQYRNMLWKRLFM